MAHSLAASILHQSHLRHDAKMRPVYKQALNLEKKRRDGRIILKGKVK